MQYSRGSQSRSRSRFTSTKHKRKPYNRSRKKTTKPSFVRLLIILLLVLFAFWGISKITSLFRSIWTKESSAQIFIEKGRAEFSLQGTDTWTRAITEQKFLPGDAIKTGNNAVVSLQFFNGYEIFLSENTELTIEKLEVASSEAKKMIFNLTSGQIWLYVPDEKLLKEGKSQFIINTPQSSISAQGTIFDVMVTPTEDIIRLVRGVVETTVNLAEKETKTITVGVGQKLIINEKNITALQAGSDILEITDNNFLQSDWHLTHLEKFSPEEAAQIRRKIEIATTAERKINEENQAAEGLNLPKADIETPVIIAPPNNTVVPANQDSIQLEGSAPEEAYQISVNGYTLTKFTPGDRKWTYFASKKFGTLVTGENTYEVIAITRDGKKSAPATINLIYEGVSVGQENPLNPPIETASFPKPIITSPALASLDDTYQTSGEVVTIVGTVPLGTQWVTVNDFRLRKFAPGDTDFSYIANARYGNMKQGNNTYRVTAFGPNGTQSTVTLKVLYQPINL